MHNKAIFLESNRLESQLVNFQLEGALLEIMKNDLMARSIIAEHRKIEKYALQLGLVNKRQLNEGILADVTLGLGQAIGSIPGLNLSGVGAAFGVAGVLWYGKEMLNSSGFDFAMNLMFCLFSAAAIEPTGAGGEIGTLAKVLSPFATLGEWARNLGTLTFETASRAFRGLSGVSQALVKGAAEAEVPIMRGFDWVEKNILPHVNEIFESIKGMIKGKPGAGMFDKIAERVSAGATDAFAVVKEGFTSLINLGRTAAGKAGTKAAKAVAEALPSLITKLSPETAKNIVAKLAEKQFNYTTTKGMTKTIKIVGFDNAGKMLMKAIGGNQPYAVAAKELPSVISQIAKSFGDEAAAAAIVSARAAYPETMIKSAIYAASGINNTTKALTTV